MNRDSVPPTPDCRHQSASEKHGRQGGPVARRERGGEMRWKGSNPVGKVEGCRAEFKHLPVDPDEDLGVHRCVGPAAAGGVHRAVERLDHRRSRRAKVAGAVPAGAWNERAIPRQASAGWWWRRRRRRRRRRWRWAMHRRGGCTGQQHQQRRPRGEHAPADTARHVDKTPKHPKTQSVPHAYELGEARLGYYRSKGNTSKMNGKRIIAEPKHRR